MEKLDMTTKTVAPDIWEHHKKHHERYKLQDGSCRNFTMPLDFDARIVRTLWVKQLNELELQMVHKWEQEHLVHRYILMKEVEKVIQKGLVRHGAMSQDNKKMVYDQIRVAKPKSLKHTLQTRDGKKYYNEEWDYKDEMNANQEFDRAIHGLYINMPEKEIHGSTGKIRGIK